MNYEQNIEHEYTYVVPTLEVGGSLITSFLSDGSVYNDNEFDTSSFTLMSLLYYACNRTNYYIGSSAKVMIAFEFTLRTGDGYFSWQFYTNKIDYVINGSYSSIVGSKIVNENNLPAISGNTVPSNYPVYDASRFEEYEYSQYIVNNLNGDYSVYDFTSLDLSTDYYLDTINIQGENISLMKSSLVFGFYQNTPKYFAYGQPFYRQRQAEYTRGYNNGHASGLVDGIEQGYQQGINAGGGNVGTQQGTAFSYIGNAFGVVSNIMSLEVLPNVTLGLCFSIPMVFVLIMTIFKLVRK